jgi:hypothetical protein
MPLTSQSQSAHPPTIAWAWCTAAVQTVWGITRMHTQQQHEHGDSETMLKKNQKRKKGLCRLKTLQPAGLQPAGLRHPATSTRHTCIHQRDWIRNMSQAMQDASTGDDPRATATYPTQRRQRQPRCCYSLAVPAACCPIARHQQHQHAASGCAADALLSHAPLSQLRELKNSKSE